MINNYLKDYCRDHENMMYIEATPTLLSADGDFRPELFRRDNIHLNRDGQRLWGALIKTAIEEIERDNVKTNTAL